VNQLTQQPPLLPVDKSFTQTVPAATLADLSKIFWLLVPSAFYYEVFDGEAKKRSFAIKGLDEFRRVDLGTLLHRETTTGLPIEEADSGPLSFNPVVLSPDWTLTDELSAVMQDYKTNVVDPALMFWNEVISTRQVPGFTTEEIKAVSGTESEFTNLCTILRDRTRIRRAASIIGFPFSDLLTESWFHFRHYQASLLNALILLRRYPDLQTTRDQLKLEHDVHDMEYLTLGLITGHLATAETSKHFSNFSMKWRFNHLRPDGELITPDSVTALLQSYVSRVSH
jgi:hypothetical protein